jgi:hypothetical protein
MQKTRISSSSTKIDNDSGSTFEKVGVKKSGNSQPPKKRVTPKLQITIIFPYSAKKNIAKKIDEYSTL